MREERVKPIAWAAAVAVAAVGNSAPAQEKPGFRDTPVLPGGKWRVHDSDRPYPTVVTPGAAPGAPPSDPAAGPQFASRFPQHLGAPPSRGSKPRL